MSMFRKAIILLFAAMPVVATAQTDDEYLAEVGAGLSLLTYEGDFNGNVLKNMKPSASVLFRRLFNPWAGIRLEASYGKLTGKSADVETYYPGMAENPWEFSHSLADLSAVFEYNFWPYGTGHDYRGAKRLTPFVFVGLGMCGVWGGEESAMAATLPMGVGVKYKVGPRLNLSVEWGIHFSTNDKLDGVADPYTVTSSGMFKNTDCFSGLRVSLTYSFLPKCRTCHNDEE